MQWEIKKFNKETERLRSLDGKPQPDLTDDQAQSLKAKVLQAVSVMPLEAAPKKNVIQKFLRYLASIIAGLSLVAGTAFASGSAIPGDVLYPVKRLTEKVKFGLAISGKSKALLQEKFAEERLSELEKVSFQIQNSEEPELPRQNPKLNLSGSVTSSSSLQSNNMDSEIRNGNSDNGNNNKFKAKQEAGMAIKSALEALERVSQESKAKGDNIDADSFKDQILELRSKAKNHGIGGHELPNSEASLEIQGSTNER